jgi:hypothetical protein
MRVADLDFRKWFDCLILYQFDPPTEIVEYRIPGNRWNPLIPLSETTWKAAIDSILTHPVPNFTFRFRIKLKERLQPPIQLPWNQWSYFDAEITILDLTLRTDHQRTREHIVPVLEEQDGDVDKAFAELNYVKEAVVVPPGSVFRAGHLKYDGDPFELEKEDIDNVFSSFRTLGG